MFQLYTRHDRLAIPHHFDFDHIADFASPQRVGEVVEILDGLVAELHQDVAGFESRFGRGRIGFTSENFTPFSTCPKSGIDPKYGPYPLPRLLPSGLVFGYNLRTRAL